MSAHFHNDILYKIEHQPQLSNNNYAQYKVYYIKTDDEDYLHARKAIASIMGYLLGYKQGAIWDKGWYQLINKIRPSVSNVAHVYYKFTYNEELGVYVYTFVKPYND